MYKNIYALHYKWNDYSWQLMNEENDCKFLHFYLQTEQLQ